MILVVVVIQSVVYLAVALLFVVGTGQTSCWLGAHHGGNWLVAGAVLEAVFTIALVCLARKCARFNGTTFQAAVSFRGGGPYMGLDAVCNAVPVYALLFAALIAAGYTVLLGCYAIG